MVGSKFHLWKNWSSSIDYNYAKKVGSNNTSKEMKVVRLVQYKVWLDQNGKGDKIKVI